MRYDVAIVGAGVCGLTAAIELSGKNLKVLVIEGASASGGRVRSFQTSHGTIIDEGAHWFHGGDDNGFYNWARKRYDLGPMVLDTVQNRIIQWQGGDIAGFDAAFERMEQVFANNPAVPEKPSLHDVASLADAVEIADFMATGWMATDDARDIAARDFFDDPLGPGGWQMEAGLQHLIHALEKEARAAGIEFVHNASVRRVEEHDGVVNINTYDEQIFKCAACLITVSVGVLEARGIQFSPHVQSVIEDKIKPLRMAHLAKAVLPVRPEFFGEREILIDTAFYVIDGNAFIHARTSGADTITLFQGGRSGCAMEAMTDEHAALHVENIFATIPLLAGYKAYQNGPISRTHWHDNPLTRGSYSYCKPEGKRPNPFNAGNIYFAGEAFVASAEHSPGQIAGAFHSGRIAASLLCI